MSSSDAVPPLPIARGAVCTKSCPGAPSVGFFFILFALAALVVGICVFVFFVLFGLVIFSSPSVRMIAVVVLVLLHLVLLAASATPDLVLLPESAAAPHRSTFLLPHPTI